jgi:hypothetical protein
LSRRADFNITVALNPAIQVKHADPDTATLQSTASAMNLRFQIGITNTGTLAARDVTVNFLTATPGVGEFYWTDEQGNRRQDESGPLITSEQLGPSWTTTRWLPRTLDRVALKTLSRSPCRPVGSSTCTLARSPSRMICPTTCRSGRRSSSCAYSDPTIRRRLGTELRHAGSLQSRSRVAPSSARP